MANKVKIFTKEGSLIMTIGNKGERAGMFYNLQGLALTRNLNLVVVHFNNTFGLQIFSSLYLVVFMFEQI